MGILDNIQRGALSQPQGILGAGADPQFYRDIAARLSQMLGVPLPSEGEGLATLAQDPRFRSPEIGVFRSMTPEGSRNFVVFPGNEDILKILNRE